MENDDTAIKVVMDTVMIDIHEMLRNVENPPFVDQFLWKLWGVQDCSISSSVSPGWLLKHIRIVHGKSGWAMSCSCWLMLADISRISPQMWMINFNSHWKIGACQCDQNVSSWQVSTEQGCAWYFREFPWEFQPISFFCGTTSAMMWGSWVIQGLRVCCEPLWLCVLLLG